MLINRYEDPEEEADLVRNLRSELRNVLDMWWRMYCFKEERVVYRDTLERHLNRMLKVIMDEYLAHLNLQENWLHGRQGD